MIVIRECRGFEELQACVDLQVEVWGYCEGDVIPRRVFLVGQKIGGQAIGAFDVRQGTDERKGTGNREQGTDEMRGVGDAGSLVGFAFGLPGVKAGANSQSGHPESYLHSHMLAVKEGYRNQSIGRRLKLAQRADALGRGLTRMEWTFDPLEIKNAFLNIHRLGAIVRRYEENFYGVSSSRLQGGLQTDRLVAEWWLDAPRVIAAVGGETVVERTPLELEIVVPAAVYEWKADEARRPLAERVQVENRMRFQRAFAEGLAVVGFRRDGEGNGIYELSPWTVSQG